MNGKFTRREALLGASSAILAQSACTVTPHSNLGAATVFAHGVASGDPDHTSIVLWTRISGVESAVEVEWEISSDANFRNRLNNGTVRTHAGRDYTVNVVADGLRPGGSYFYRFIVGGAHSPVGRTKTLPLSHVEELVIAVASCSNYPFGHFNAYDDIANDDSVDVVAHLGDYIYEYDENGYGGETGRRLGRVHEPRHETVTLADYRTRHAQYKSDAGSRAMHARHPLIAIWDDHESANNPWMGGAQNHQPDEGSWEERRKASLTAYYEWMPIRPPANEASMADYWRHFRFGDLVSLITLESRHTGRSLQIEYGDLSRFTTPAAAQAFYRDVVGDSSRRFLSHEMEEFLAEALHESVEAGRRWRVIGNQSVMAKMIQPDIDTPFFQNMRSRLTDFERSYMDALTLMGKLGLTGDLDSWAGYPAARENFYQIAKDAGSRDLLVISGDSHSFWANSLHDADGKAMGVELGTTGVTSPRSLLAVGREGVARFDDLIADINPEIEMANGRHNGYIRLQIQHAGARADFIALSNIESPEYTTNVIFSTAITAADGSLQFVDDANR